jgi:hypothetical protein
VNLNVFNCSCAAFNSNLAKDDSVLDFKVTQPNLAVAFKDGDIFSSVKSGAKARTESTTVAVFLATSNKLDISSHLKLTSWSGCAEGPYRSINTLATSSLKGVEATGKDLTWSMRTVFNLAKGWSFRHMNAPGSSHSGSSFKSFDGINDLVSKINASKDRSRNC